MHRNWIVAVGFLACLLLTPETRADPGDKNPSKVFVGYVIGSTKEIDYKLYTHLAHAFLQVDTDGKLQTRANVPSRELTTDAHKAGVQVILSLGGGSRSQDQNFAAIARRPETEKRFVADVLKIVDEYDYDGIDFDWEYPDTDVEVTGYERMTRQFRAGVDAIGRRKGRTMRITMALSSNPGTIRWLSTPFLVETMDWINVMTYDYAGPWTDYAGHQAPLHASSRQPGTVKRSTVATLEYLLNERKLPADRLALGIPLYGRGFPVAEPYASTKGKPKREDDASTYAQIAQFQADGWTRTWDEETKNPWLTAPDKSAVIGYDDAESVRLKTEWAMRKGLRGVFFWQIGADRMSDNSHPLQAASHTAWKATGLP